MAHFFVFDILYALYICVPFHASEMSSSSRSDDISSQSSGFATDDEEEQRDRILEKQNIVSDLKFGGLDELISESESASNADNEQ